MAMMGRGPQTPRPVVGPVRDVEAYARSVDSVAGGTPQSDDQRHCSWRNPGDNRLLND